MTIPPLTLDDADPQGKKLVRDLCALAARYNIANALLDPIMAAITTETSGMQHVHVAEYLEGAARLARQEVP